MRLRSAVVAGVGAVGLVVGLGNPAGAATAGTERFLILQTSPTSRTAQVSATGPVHALGTDLTVSATRDRFTFPAGSMAVAHARTAGHQSYDRKTCTARFSEQGTYRVVSGTGAYAHASGHGTYWVTGVAIGCDPTAPPTAFSVVVRAAGPLTL